jgi:hypothetical protein
MYCPHCGKNNAFNAQDVNMRVEIIVCPDCRTASWPVPQVEDLKRDLEKIRDRMRSIPNMPLTEED